MLAQKRKTSTQLLVLGAILTALVIILQLMGSFIHLGMFSISLVLIPIVIGAATCGTGIGAWLGFVFGIAVLLSGDAAAFLAISIPGTVITVIAKGIVCGLAAGIVYNSLEKYNRYLAVAAAAVICPVANTGVFLAGSGLFFLNALKEAASNEGQSLIYYIFFFLIGGNFLFELGSNIIFSPIIVRLINIRKKGLN